MTAWFDVVSGAVHDETVLDDGSSSAIFGSLVPTATGMRVVARASPDGSSRLVVFDQDAPARSEPRATGPTVPNRSAPTGVALPGGDMLVAVGGADDVVSTVYRFGPDGGDAVPELGLPGYAQPTLAAGGGKAWVVAVRGDGLVVSRWRSAVSGWSTGDRVEIGAEGGNHLAWPNAVRDTDGRLRLVVEGPPPSGNTSSVLAFQRLIDEADPPGNPDPPGDPDPPADPEPPSNPDSPADTDPPASTNPPTRTDPPADTDEEPAAEDDDKPARVRCRVGKVRRSRDGRVLRVRLVCSGNLTARTTRVRARLSRRTRTLSRGNGKLRRGRGEIRLRAGKSVPRGRYRLTLRIGRATVRRTVRVR